MTCCAKRLPRTVLIAGVQPARVRCASIVSCGGGGGGGGALGASGRGGRGRGRRGCRASLQTPPHAPRDPRTPPPPPRARLQAVEELVHVLVLARVNGRPVDVLERAPEALGRGGGREPERHRREHRLQLREHAVRALARGHLGRAQDERADARLHVQLLEQRVHVARRARVAQAAVVAGPPHRARRREREERGAAAVHERLQRGGALLQRAQPLLHQLPREVQRGRARAGRRRARAQARLALGGVQAPRGLVLRARARGGERGRRGGMGLGPAGAGGGGAAPWGGAWRGAARRGTPRAPARGGTRGRGTRRAAA